MSRVHAIVAVHRRNLGLLRGDPSLFAQGILVPLVVLLLCAVIFGGGGDDWPVAIVDHAASEEAQDLRSALDQSRSQTSPYFDVLEVDPQRAARLLDEGRLHLVLTIPETFPDEDLQAATHNVNTDAMKNVRLRVLDVLNRYDRQRGTLALSAQLNTARDSDVPRSAFLAGSATLLALTLGAALVAGNLYAVDEESRSLREFALTPLGPATGAAGVLVTAVAVGYLSAVPTALTGWLAFGLAPDPAALGRVALFLAPLMTASAAVGVLTAQVVRRHRAIQPLLIVAGITSFFATGGFTGVGGLPPVARVFAQWWPPSRIYEWLNPVLHGFDDSFSRFQWGWALLAATVLATAAVALARREQTRLAGAR